MVGHKMGEMPDNVVPLTGGTTSRRRVPPDKAALLRRVPPFDRLDADAIEPLARQSRELELPRASTLYPKGDTGRGLFVVVSGQVKLTFPSANGNEKILEVLGPQSVFGECAVFQEGNCHFFVQALQDSFLLFVPREPVLTMLDGHPAFMRGMFDLMTDRVQFLVGEVESLSLKTSMQRVIDYLVELSREKNGTGMADSINLSTSKQVLAARLNLTPETLSRIFAELAGEGLIKVEGRSIVVRDWARLSARSPAPAGADAQALRSSAERTVA